MGDFSKGCSLATALDGPDFQVVGNLASLQFSPRPELVKSACEDSQPTTAMGRNRDAFLSAMIDLKGGGQIAPAPALELSNDPSFPVAPAKTAAPGAPGA